ncbi:Panacea domain-containing protein [Pannonibacter sp. Q-1]
MTTFKAAKTIWDLCSGRVSNLSMQKLLYLAHMLELGAGRGPLVSNSFEAWDYGPVEPQLYHKLKAYGASNVPDIFGETPYTERDDQYSSIKSVVDELGAESPRKLVAITHWPEGAWSKHFVAGMRSIKIPDSDIEEEFRKRVRRQAAR